MIVCLRLFDILDISRIPIPARDMISIEVPILTIIVPLASYGLTIILHEDITRLPHISVKYLHDRWLLELCSEFD